MKSSSFLHREIVDISSMEVGAKRSSKAGAGMIIADLNLLS